MKNGRTMHHSSGLLHESEKSVKNNGIADALASGMHFMCGGRFRVMVVELEEVDRCDTYF